MFRFKTSVLKKNISISVSPLSKALDRFIKDMDFSNEDVVQATGLYTAAAIGNYRKGRRKVPSDLIEKIKEVYGVDLMSNPETTVSTNKTNVSRETKGDPWDSVNGLIEAFKLNSEQHKEEVQELRKDKEKLNEDKAELFEMIRFLRSMNMSAHKT